VRNTINAHLPGQAAAAAARSGAAAAWNKCAHAHVVWAVPIRTPVGAGTRRTELADSGKYITLSQGEQRQDVAAHVWQAGRQLLQLTHAPLYRLAQFSFARLAHRCHSSEILRSARLHGWQHGRRSCLHSGEYKVTCAVLKSTQAIYEPGLECRQNRRAIGRRGAL